MLRNKLIQLILQRHSYLCVGLDTDVQKLPLHLRENKNGILLFNKAIIDATRDYCVSYKPNIAFYESLGSKGWDILGETLEYIGAEHFTIADAKRGDIGNTASMYARTFFETYSFDGITVAPYMGEDSVMPFLEYDNKWVILLALTSNRGAFDFQFTKNIQDEMLFETVIQKAQQWGTINNLMYVIGATKAQYIERVRELAPSHFLLIPGIGVQGGSLHDISLLGMNHDIGLLVNNTREIIYASNGEDFAIHAQKKAKGIQEEMSKYLQVRLL